jgi:hypothetical protein
MSLVIGDLIGSASYKLKVGRTEAQAKLIIIHQAAVKSGAEALRARIAQQICIIGNCKFLVDSQILNWANKVCLREDLPLGSLGSKKLAVSESSFTKGSRLPSSEVCERKPASLRHS